MNSETEKFSISDTIPELPTFFGQINYICAEEYDQKREEFCECGRVNEWVELCDYSHMKNDFWGCKLCYLKANRKDLINKLIDNARMILNIK